MFFTAIFTSKDRKQRQSCRKKMTSSVYFPGNLMVKRYIRGGNNRLRYGSLEFEPTIY